MTLLEALVEEIENVPFEEWEFEILHHGDRKERRRHFHKDKEIEFITDGEEAYLKGYEEFLSYIERRKLMSVFRRLMIQLDYERISKEYIDMQNHARQIFPNVCFSSK